GSVPAAEGEGAGTDNTTVCTVLSHAPNNSYAMRQLRALPTPVRIGELIAVRALVGGEWQVGVVRWFRNTMTQQLIEFGCEILGRNPEAVAVVVERVDRRRPHPAVLLAAEPDLEWNETLITAAHLLDVGRTATLQKR